MTQCNDVVFQERSDTIESLVMFPIVQSEANRRRRSSGTASVSQLSAPSPSGQAGASRSRRVSVGGASNFPTPSTSGQSETQPTPGSSDIPAAPASRRGSQSRRSSIAAAAFGQSKRDSAQGDGKKGSIGFGTLASSLVKWKMSTLRATKKSNETIAKVKHTNNINMCYKIADSSRVRKHYFVYFIYVQSYIFQQQRESHCEPSYFFLIRAQEQ